MASFSLALRTQATLHVDGEPSDFVTEYHGDLVCTDDETGDDTVAGHVRAQRVQAGLAADHGESLFDVCDSHSQELCDLHALLYEPGGYGFRDALSERYHAYDADLLVLDYIVLDPRWRGLRVGLLAARKAADLLGGGCGLVVSEVLPLRRDAHKQLGVPADWLPDPATKAGRAAARMKLRSYFRRMGFRRLGRTDYYVLSPALDAPTARNLLRPRSDSG